MSNYLNLSNGTIPDIVLNSGGSISTTGNIFYTGSTGSSNLNTYIDTTMGFPKNISVDAGPEIYDYDIGDLVICKADGEYKDKVGKITRRDYSAKAMVSDKKVVEIVVKPYYYIKFEAEPKDPPAGYGLHASMYSIDPYFQEQDLELAFAK